MKSAKILPFPRPSERPNALLDLVTDVMKARETTSDELKAKQQRLLEALQRRRTDPQK